MSSSGYAHAKNPNTSVAKEIKELGDRGVSLIDAVGKRPQRATQASRMGFGREDAICE
jgi:hypothetical protein